MKAEEKAYTTMQRVANRMAEEDNAIRERARAANDKRLDELEDEFGV